MMKPDIRELLTQIDPSGLGYQEWVNVGMALKEEGFTAADWDTWSARDAARYHAGECLRKWNSFGGTGKPVTGGTIVQYAKDHGWKPPVGVGGIALAWDAAIGEGEKSIPPPRDIPPPPSFSKAEQVRQLVTYLETLFEPGEYVGYVTSCREKDGRYMPSRGAVDRTAGELTQLLLQCNGDIGSVIGDTNPKAGAWIRFNPLDGRGVKNENVIEYRYALVESDEMELSGQYDILQRLQLPIALLVHSGKRSLHAIVKIGAGSSEEYRRRVDFLYEVCAKNGLKIDTQNRNPSRLSRMPGVYRDLKPQYIIAKGMGKGSWEQWMEGNGKATGLGVADKNDDQNDDLPEPENLLGIWDKLPALAPALIEGVLRQGHKMLLAGPSKAGKSYALIQLCIAIAEGRKWLGWQCAKGRVLYVNLELDRASCLHRFRDVYGAMHVSAQNLQNIDIWNLRGKALPMDELAPKLIRRAMKRGYIAIVLDPIYKVITGDENSADQMANFCNQFDKVSTELSSAVIYCHHHSKGMQAAKRSMDRASGSGVFARDPDALIDMLELEVPEELRGAGATAWRVEGTLREFERFAPVNLWFEYPVHRVDEAGSLANADMGDGGASSWRAKRGKRKGKPDRAKERRQTLETAYEALQMAGDVTIAGVMEYTGLTRNTVKAYVDEHPNFQRGANAIQRV